MQSSYYSAAISNFLVCTDDAILGELTRRHHHALEHEQRGAWLSQIAILQAQLEGNPNCHRRAHFGKDAKARNDEMQHYVRTIEKDAQVSKRGAIEVNLSLPLSAL